jgi:hypothetical protein
MRPGASEGEIEGGQFFLLESFVLKKKRMREG